MKIVIFGGTGSLGHALCKVVSKQEPQASIYIVSRCELRQKEHRKAFPTMDITYILGDVRDHYASWQNLLPNKADRVYNLAASKHVELCEENVEHSVETNYIGVINTYNYANYAQAHYIYTSTDKAVRPVNAYGMAKALGAKFLQNKDNATVFLWANILGSRGSFLHLIKEKLINNKPVPLTHARMTRFWLHIDDVAMFLWENSENKNNGPVTPSMKSAPLTLIIELVAEYLNIDSYKFEPIGLRPGEKLHEEIKWSAVQGKLSSKSHNRFTKEELKTLIKRVLDADL